MTLLREHRNLIEWIMSELVSASLPWLSYRNCELPSKRVDSSQYKKMQEVLLVDLLEREILTIIISQCR